MAAETSDQIIRHQAMLARLYVAALLADESLADQVWALWDAGLISDGVAAWAWYLIVSSCFTAR